MDINKYEFPESTYLGGIALNGPANTDSLDQSTSASHCPVGSNDVPNKCKTYAQGHGTPSLLADHADANGGDWRDDLCL